MQLAILIDADADPQYIEYTLTNAARLVSRNIETLGIPQPGLGHHLPMQNYLSVQNAFFFHSPE